MRQELQNSRSRLSEVEKDRQGIITSLKDLDHVASRDKNEKQQLDNAQREEKKRMHEMMNELDCLRKYGEHQDRKSRELEEHIIKTESQMEKAIRSQGMLERELVADQASVYVCI